MISRRSALFGGLVSLAAPAIIRVPGLLMAIKPPKLSYLAQVYWDYGRYSSINPFPAEAAEEWVRQQLRVALAESLGVKFADMALDGVDYHEIDLDFSGTWLE